MADASRHREERLRWLKELTSIPTASGKEDRVIAWIERWVAERAGMGARLRRDPAGNLVVELRADEPGAPSPSGRGWRRLGRQVRVIATGAECESREVGENREEKEGERWSPHRPRSEATSSVRHGRGSGAASATSQSLSGGFTACDGVPAAGSPGAPLLITAHLDHPAFVVEGFIGDSTLNLSFRGGMGDAYFTNARIVVHSGGVGGSRIAARVLESTNAEPWRTAIAELERVEHASRVRVGDVATWDLPDAEVIDGLLHAPACDDLAGVAAALGAFDEALRRIAAGEKLPRPLWLLLTRAEEVGFIGAIAACKHGTIPPGASVIALETSRSFADSPIGAGPIVRVGDRAWTFSPGLTGAAAKACERLEQRAKAASPPSEFAWQRKLMAGGTCEATCFGAYGHEATCLCLALGNYHNQGSLERVQAGETNAAKIEREIVSVADFEGLAAALVECAFSLKQAEPLAARMDRLYAEKAFVLG